MTACFYMDGNGCFNYVRNCVLRYMHMIKKFIRKITRTGSNSFTINVPKEIVKTLAWRERQKLEVTFDEKKKEFKTKDWKK